MNKDSLFLAMSGGQMKRNGQVTAISIGLRRKSSGLTGESIQYQDRANDFSE